MNKMLMTGLCFLFTRFMQGAGSYQGFTEDLTKLKMAKIYLHAIKISRLLFISLLGSGACLMLFLTGLVLIHYTILSYAPWDVSVKVTVTLIFASLYILIAVGAFFYFFAEDKWMKMFHTDAMIKELTDRS